MQKTTITRIRFQKDLKTANKIMNDSGFAETYLITNNALINKVRNFGRETFGIMPYTTEELARRLLSEFWLSNWQRLRTYKGNERLDSWLYRCSCQMLFPIFVKEGQIRSSTQNYHKGDYSIRWEEMYKDIRKDVIALISIGTYREILNKCYVDMLPINQIVESYSNSNFNEIQVKKLLDDAESTLIRILLNSNTEYSIYLVPKGKRVTFTDIDTVETTMGYETEEQGIWGNILELLKSEGGSDDYVENLRILIINVTTKAEWSDMEKSVVIKRLIYKEPPVRVANEFGVSRTYIDNYYSVRRKRLIKLIREHWGLAS